MRVNQVLWINNEIYFHFKFNVTIKKRRQQQQQQNPAAISLKSNNKNKKYLDSERYKAHQEVINRTCKRWIDGNLELFYALMKQ